MNMNIKKVMKKLDNYFDLSEKKQDKKRGKLLKIIRKLEEKKAELKVEMAIASGIDETSEDFHNLKQEKEVLTKLLKKAKHQYMPEEGVEET